jgi:hypothetical protein
MKTGISPHCATLKMRSTHPGTTQLRAQDTSHTNQISRSWKSSEHPSQGLEPVKTNQRTRKFPNTMLTKTGQSLVVALMVSVASGCTVDAIGVEEVEEAPVGSQAALTEGYPVGTPLVTTAYVNVRKSSDKSSAVLQVLPPGTKVLSASRSPQNGYYGVSTNKFTGWISGLYLTANGAPGDGGSPDTDDPPPANPGTFTRQGVYDLVKNRHNSNLRGSARDLLDSGMTTQALVNAVGWIAANNPPSSWGYSTMVTGHRPSEAHSPGHAIDVFANDPAQDAAMMRLVNNNPYIVEVGLAGTYKNFGSMVNDPSKCKFMDNDQTHIHIAVENVFCTP